jgi:hypothetical protein
MTSPVSHAHIDSPKSGLTTPIALGATSWLIYAAISWLSRDYGYETPGSERPILTVLVLLSVAFLCYLAALRAAVRADGRRDLVLVIWLFAIAFRATLLFTEPFQEIDVYRYIWDGRTATSGVSPYRFSPSQVRSADARDPLPDDLQRLVILRDSNPHIATILSRIHYGELTTVYPPVSQAVFAAAAATTPRNANLRTHLAVMKCWITAFDLVTLHLLILILRHVGKPVGWSVAYGWCPLVVKEFANSGHLDSIAVCLTTAAVYFALKAFFPSEAAAINNRDNDRPRRSFQIASASVLLGLAIGAKLFPVVLAPLLFVTAVRRSGWRTAVAAGLTAGVVSAGALFPMFADRGVESIRRERADHGLSAFLSRWKMNDFLFQLVEANASIRIGKAGEPWFAVTPLSWRESAIQWTRRSWGAYSGKELPDGPAAFLFARFVTATAFLILALWFAWKAPPENRPERFLELAFLTLAWFWLLLPTQNPWYWIWALPLVPFARGRAWMAMSGLVLCYYARFWFVHHSSGVEVFHTPYRGADFFDKVVVWLEYAPWFVWLAAACFLRARRK